MVQVMFIYFAPPMVLLVRIDPVPAAIITIVINSWAYIAEITQAILSINKGFKEASPRWDYRRAAPLGGMSVCRWLFGG